MDSLTKWLKITNQFQPKDELDKPSHLLLNGYKLYVSDENIPIFNEKYADTIINENAKLYVVECKKDTFQLFFDLDFNLTEEMMKKINTNDVYCKIIQIINDVIYDFYNDYYDCIVTTAEPKKISKIIKNDENPDNIKEVVIYKKGFHLHFPDIKINKNYALEIRKYCILKLADYNTMFDNKINDIVDEHVFTGSGLRLTGSRKGHFVSQTKEFVDEGRPYELEVVLRDNIIDDDLFLQYKNDYKMLIEKTSIISTDTSITNIMNNPNLECGECNFDVDEPKYTGSWIRLEKTNLRYIEILRFFNTYVKDYSTKDIKRIFCSENENVYILCSLSKYCLNIGRNHKSEHIYFKLNKDGISQKCFCRCDTLEGRKHGYCKDYESKPIPCTPQIRKILDFKEQKEDKTKILKNNRNNNTSINLNSLFDGLRMDMYNQFTNKEQLPSKKYKPSK